MERIFIPSFSFSTDSYSLVFEQFSPPPPPPPSSLIIRSKVRLSNEMYDETRKLDTINSIERLSRSVYKIWMQKSVADG